MGLVMSAGRVGSIVGPYTAGRLLGAQFDRLTVCALLAAPVLLSIAALLKVPLTPVAVDDPIDPARLAARSAP
jgi:hypothetical protein